MMQAEQTPLPLTTKQQQWRAKYGPWAVVTGASDGIGRETAIALAQTGLNLVLVARRRPLLEQLAADLSTRSGIETLVIEADLTRFDAVEHVMALTQHLDVGLLVASAGFGTSGRLIDSPLEAELNMIDVNCRSVLAMSQMFGRRFARQRRGGIVLMSSLLAFQGVPFAANYAATKAYVQSLAEGLRVELAPFGVDVVASAPGPVHTGFETRADMRMTMALKPAEVARATLDALGRRGTVRPGLLSKLLESGLAALPRWGRVRAMGRVMQSMTRHQAGAG
jgi:short-subunit dehydrogenase